MSDQMLQRWWHEHSELDELVEVTRAQLEKGAFSTVILSLERLSLTLEAHFATEETLYFPLIERTSPRSGPLLQQALSGHRRLRHMVEDVRVVVENADTAAALRALAALLQRLHKHEKDELGLISTLEEFAHSEGGLDRG